MIRASTVAFAGLLLLGGCVDDGGPRLESVMPASAAHDATVTITGRRLCGASADCASAAGQVQIGLDAPIVRANVTSYTDTRADIVIPELAPAGVTKIVVTVNERASNSIDFEVLP